MDELGILRLATQLRGRIFFFFLRVSSPVFPGRRRGPRRAHQLPRVPADLPQGRGRRAGGGLRAVPAGEAGGGGRGAGGGRGCQGLLRGQDRGHPEDEQVRGGDQDGAGREEADGGGQAAEAAGLQGQGRHVRGKHGKLKGEF